MPVRNDGLVVDAYTFVPLGVPAAWATVEPAELGLLPGEEAVVTVRFAPPRTATTPPGAHRFGLRVVSREDPDTSVAEEGILEVASFVDVGAEMQPRTISARGRRQGRCEVAVDNRGNTVALVQVAVTDADEKVAARQPAPLEVPPGGSCVVPVSIAGAERLWRGAERRLPFTALVQPSGADAVALEGTLVQRPALPAWALKAALGAVALAVVLAALWLAVLRPTIESSARAAAAREAEKVAESAQESQQAAAAEQEAAIDDLAAAVEEQAAAGEGAAAEPEPAEATPAPGTAGASIDPLGDPRAVRVAATAADQTPTVVLSADRIVSVLDLLLQNPAGDTGLVEVTRDGATVYAARLENFRDLDIHLVAQLEFAPGDDLGLEVTCENPAEPARPCTPALTVSGFARTPPA